MNTPAHLLFAGALFGKKNTPRLTWFAMLGGLMPDLSLYLLAGSSLFILGYSPQVVFDELYFSDLWQTIFSVDNSFLIWGGVLLLGVCRKRPALTAFSAGALLHIAFDFPLHHDDGRAHFWPISSWVFESPVSYWDRSHHASWVQPLETSLACIAAIFCWRQSHSILLRLVVSALILMQVFASGLWQFIFV